MTAPPALVSPEWLAEQLGDEDLRVLDATVLLTLDPAGGRVTIKSGREGWAKGHVPGAVFADLIELSDPADPVRFMLPSPETFAEGMSGLGVGPGTRVVAYDRETGAWAARLWWMLRVFGFDEVGVLDGGWQAWRDQGLPASTEPPEHPTARFEAVFRPDLVATRKQVEAYMADGGTCIVNALPAVLHSGEAPVAHGRGGHIPGSVNVPGAELVDPETNRMLAPEQLRERFEAVGALGDRKVVTYCGGGIDASFDAFALAVLGRDDAAVYDGSLVEWAEDPAAPLESG